MTQHDLWTEPPEEGAPCDDDTPSPRREAKPLTAADWEYALANAGLAHRIANKLRGLTEDEREDLDQELLIALAKGHAGYDPERGEATLATYASSSCYNAMTDWVKRRDRAREQVPVEDEALSALAEPDAMRLDEEGLVMRDLRRLLANPIVRAIPGRLREALHYRYGEQQGMFQPRWQVLAPPDPCVATVWLSSLVCRGDPCVTDDDLLWLDSRIRDARIEPDVALPVPVTARGAWTIARMGG